MRVLLIGGGGREDALAWALSRSPEVDRLRCAPGSAGIGLRGECVDIPVDDVDGLVRHASAERYDLVVIGPEAPLVAGLADRLRDAGIATFGPGAAAATLEGSKVEAKRFMRRHDVPTAGFHVFEDVGEARRHLASPDTDYPLVVKADGLAAGKGVVIAADAETAIAAAEGMLSGRDFGDAGRRIVVEECLVGREASFFVLSDGTRAVELATCQDYKRIGDGDTGPNTGGMGTYSPSAWLDDDARRTIRERVIEPTIRGLAAEGRPYRGVLFVGLMLTDAGPRVLEYNVRFGDPETQVLMPRLDGDWLPLLHGAAVGDLAGVEPRWRPEAAVCVVMAAEGYPGTYPKGRTIEGLDRASALPGVTIFHAGTGREGGAWVTRGGRVLGVTAVGASLAEARDRAYAAVDTIRWDGAQHRRDIARDALERQGDDQR